MANEPNTTETPETAEERERLLGQLTPDEREIVENILRNHPALTAAECIEYARAMGL